MKEVTVPQLFICPISLELFKDPVTLSTGQTYERSSIETWLAAGNSTCPVTMQNLHDLSLVPNCNLRHLIHLWHQTRVLDQRLDGSLAAALKLTLESSQASLENKVQTLHRIQALIKESPSATNSFLQMGLLPLLFQLLFRHSEAKMSGKYCYLRFAEEALSCALSLLPLCDLGFLNMIRGGPEMHSFMLLFELGSSVVKKRLCLLVEGISISISSSSQTKEEVCAILGQNSRFLKGLVLLIRQKDDTSDAGIRALLGLCSLRSNVENLVGEGAMDGLIAYISSHQKRRIEVSVAMATLEQLLGVKGGQESILMNPDGVRALVKMVFRVSDHEGCESAINSLMIICNESREGREKAIAVGVLTQLLLLLQSQCNGKAKTKARMLLKLLKSK